MHQYKEEFTPGPWTTLDYVSKVSNFGGWQGRIEAGGVGIGKAFGDDKKTTLANVRLMAAAPDLMKLVDELTMYGVACEGAEAAWARTLEKVGALQAQIAGIDG